MRTKGFSNFVFCFFSLLVCLSSCRTAGIYTSNPKSKMAFAGTEFQLTKSDSFFIKSWTDNYTRYVDENGNQIFKVDNRYRGFGTYECLKDSLKLNFCNEDSIRINLDISRGEDFNEISIHIYNEMGILQAPEVSILNSEYERLERNSNEYKDVFHFEISGQGIPKFIKLNSRWLNIENPTIDISTLEDGRHIIKRKSYNGYFAKGIKTIWFKRRPTGIRYQLHNKKRYLPKKWGWNWINNLYRDY